MWQDFLTAICLMLIIEGMIPFLYPQRWKALVASLAQIDARRMRMMGLFSMVLGAASLYVVR